MSQARWALVVGVLLMGSSASEAGWLGSSSKQPKAISLLGSTSWDTSRIKHSVRSNHKYNQPSWGALWKQTLLSTPFHQHPYTRGL